MQQKGNWIQNSSSALASQIYLERLCAQLWKWNGNGSTSAAAVVSAREILARCS
jgi:hypothetical protein